MARRRPDDDTSFDPSEFDSTSTGDEFEDALLDDLDTDWQDTDAAESYQVPIGKFVLDISAAYVSTSSSGRRQVVWELVIDGGPHADHIIRKYDGLEPAQSLAYFKRGLLKLGIGPKLLPKSVKELPALLLATVGSKVEGATKESNGYVNVYFNRMVSPSDQLKKIGVGANAKSKTQQSSTEKKSTRRNKF